MLAAPSAMKKLRPSPPEPAVPYCHWSNVTSRPRLDADAFVYTAPPLRLPVASVSCRYPVEALADGDPTRRAQTPSDDEVDAGATVARVRQPSPSARHEPSVTVEPVNDSETRAEPVAVVATGAAEAGAATATSAPSATTAGTSTPTTRRLTVNRPRSVAILLEGTVSPCIAWCSSHLVYRVGAVPGLTVEAAHGAAVLQFVNVWSRCPPPGTPTSHARGGSRSRRR